MCGAWAAEDSTTASLPPSRIVPCAVRPAGREQRTTGAALIRSYACADQRLACGPAGVRLRADGPAARPSLGREPPRNAWQPFPPARRSFPDSVKYCSVRPHTAMSNKPLFANRMAPTWHGASSPCLCGARSRTDRGWRERFPRPGRDQTSLGSGQGARATGAPFGRGWGGLGAGDWVPKRNAAASLRQSCLVSLPSVAPLRSVVGSICGFPEPTSRIPHRASRIPPRASRLAPHPAEPRDSAAATDP